MGDGKAHAKVEATTTDMKDASPVVSGFTEDRQWKQLAVGDQDTAKFDHIGQRRILEQGRVDGAEFSFKLEVMGRAGVAISDLMAEVGS